jgi:hypothetical protein
MPQTINVGTLAKRRCRKVDQMVFRNEVALKADIHSPAARLGVHAMDLLAKEPRF